MTTSEIITIVISIITMLITAGGLFFTIRSFQKQLQLNFFSDYTKRYQEIMLNFPESINQNDFDFNNLSEEEKNKTLRYMRAYFDLCSEEYFLSKENNLDKKFWNEWESGIKYALSKKAFQDGWQKITLDTKYYQDFSSFVNGNIDSRPQ